MELKYLEKHLHTLSHEAAETNKFKNLIVMEALTLALNHFSEQTSLNISWLQTSISEAMASKLETEMLQLSTGLFIIALKSHGASVNDSCEAFAAWQEKSPAYAKQAYYNLRDSKVRHWFSDFPEKILFDLISNKPRKFKDFVKMPKTLEAYDKAFGFMFDPKTSKTDLNYRAQCQTFRDTLYDYFEYHKYEDE